MRYALIVPLVLVFGPSLAQAQDAANGEGWLRVPGLPPWPPPKPLVPT